MAGFPNEHDLVALAATIRTVPIRIVFQPIVEIATRRPVAYEALARGPAGTAWESPAELFAAAQRCGMLAELDRRCLALALSIATDAGLAAPFMLFVNVEPIAWSGGAELDPRLADAPFGVVLEITERSILADPASLLEVTTQGRALGLGLAIDDAGISAGSLAVLPVLEPEVIKLDLGLIQHSPTLAVAEVVAAANAHAELTGALILAEGIETEEQEELAIAMGASLGQGWLYGRAADLPNPLPQCGSAPVRWAEPGEAADDASSPFDLVGPPQWREATGPLLGAMSRFLEYQAMNLGSAAIVLTALQDAANLTPRIRRRYEELSERCALVAVFGRGFAPADDDGGLRLVDVPTGDRLADEWDVVVLAPHFAAALIAREVPPTGGIRRFEYALTYDRRRVSEAARTLLRRVSG